MPTTRLRSALTLITMACIGDREELVPTGSYPVDLLADLLAHGIRVREVDAQRVLVLRGTAVTGRIGPDGARQGSDVPGVMGFAEAE